jgi:type III secretion protein X
MKRIGNTPFPLDRGIDKILRLDDEKNVETGYSGDISPAFSPVKPRLEQLYALPNLEDYIAAELAPLMHEAGMLMPNRFNRALRDGEEHLQLEEEEDPRNARILRAARRLMNDQVSLRELVQMYRTALLKG